MPQLSAESLPPIVLAFAASDPTGGAGIQADIMTLASMGCHPLSVITAITVQDTSGVEDILPIDADWIADQARALLEDIPVAAFKLGMLGSVEAIAAIAEIIADYPDIPLILDPVLASGRGDQFANEDMIDAMMELLLPQTTIITPNSPRLAAWRRTRTATMTPVWTNAPGASSTPAASLSSSPALTKTPSRSSTPSTAKTAW